MITCALTFVLKSYATSVTPDKPTYPRNLVRSYPVRYKVIHDIVVSLSDKVASDQTAQMRMLL